MAGTKYKPKQWPISEAAREFGCDADTLSKALTRAGVAPAFDKKFFSTQQIVTALFGDYDSQRTRKVTAEADLLEIAKAEKRRALVVAADFVAMAQQGLQAMTATVMGMTELNIEQREKIINQLRECGATVAGFVESGDASAEV